MAGELHSASSRFQRTFSRLARDRFIPRSIAWSNAAGSGLNGAPLTITAGPSSIRLPAPAVINWKKNWANGNGSPPPLLSCCNRAERSEAHMLMQRLREMFGRSGRRESDAADELKFHLEKEIEKNIAA